MKPLKAIYALVYVNARIICLSHIAAKTHTVIYGKSNHLMERNDCFAENYQCKIFSININTLVYSKNGSYFNWAYVLDS